jgi:hypothetical protein
MKSTTHSYSSIALYKLNCQIRLYCQSFRVQKSSELFAELKECHSYLLLRCIRKFDEHNVTLATSQNVSNSSVFFYERRRGAIMNHALLLGDREVRYTQISVANILATRPSDEPTPMPSLPVISAASEFIGM